MTFIPLRRRYRGAACFAAMQEGYGAHENEDNGMRIAEQPPVCPQCGERLYHVWENVTEQRKYRFSLTHNQYVGYSDPVDDTAKLDNVVCPHCLEALPESFIETLFETYDAFTISP